MKILVISAAFPPMKAGEADHTFHLCNNLANKGVEVQVLTTQNACSSPNSLMHVHPVMFSWSWLELPRFIRYVKECSPDGILLLYIGWIYNDHPMISFTPTICKFLFPNVPFVTLFEFWSGTLTSTCPLHTRLLRKFVKLWAGERHVDYEFGTLLRDSDRLILLSEEQREQLSKRNLAVNEKYALIPPPPVMQIFPDSDGLAREKGRKALGMKDDVFLIAYFGYIYPPKGIETLLRAFSIVNEKKRNTQLILIGGVIAHTYKDRPFYFQELKELVKELGIEHKIKWTGEYDWDSDEASLYLRASDISVFPFNYGVHLNNSSVAAAANHGLPIVTTKGDKLESPFKDGGNMMLCSPQSPQKLASHIERLIDDPSLRKKLSLGALELAQEWYSWERATGRILGTLSRYPKTGQ